VGVGAGHLDQPEVRVEATDRPALDRVQFDRPIAGFQAVRHRLAEALVAVEGAAAALDGAWDDGSPLAAAIAGAACGHSARTVRRHCQHLLAGIGFTTEHDLHRFVRRSIVLDGLLGDARTVAAEVGAEVLASRELPSLLPL
jgi:alkylation response protein AidB-like acyl-CoA dehydrogenase